MEQPVNAGYLKGFFSVGKQYNKDGQWKLACCLCEKPTSISTGDGRTQNVLNHLARMHLDVLTPIVMKEVIKSWAKSDEVLKEDKKLPVTAKRSFDAMEVDSKCIKRVFAEWLIADGLPFNALEGRGFHQLLTFLRPDIESYPGRRTVIKELPIMTSQLEITLRVEMETALAVSVQDFELPYFASMSALLRKNSEEKNGLHGRSARETTPNHWRHFLCSHRHQHRRRLHRHQHRH